MIVDTSFILDIIDDVDAALTKERELESESVPLVIPSMTVLELYIGVEKVANTREERRKVDAVLNSYPLVDMTPSISRRAGRLLGERIADADEDEGPGIGKGDAESLRPHWSVMSPCSLGTATSGTFPGSPTKRTDEQHSTPLLREAHPVVRHRSNSGTRPITSIYSVS
jgi:predicted nucleic acid-binding protein